MPSIYTCYFPKEWAVIDNSLLRKIVTREATKQWQRHQYIEGTTIRLKNVTAKLVHYDFGVWMRKSWDQSDYPDVNEYSTLISAPALQIDTHLQLIR
ncbi:orph-D6, partial [Microplitis demolitor]